VLLLAGVADPVAVAVLLARVGDQVAVVARVVDPVAVGGAVVASRRAALKLRR
jgi:hypothetical protein